MPSEAQARIKINRLLEESGWRFFDDKIGSANIQLEHNVKLSQRTIDDLGDNFEKRASGFVDFLLLDFRGIPTSRSKPIPMSPLEVQKEIVAEIEGYQNVIDGAHDILEIYDSHITIDPELPIAELG